MTFATASTRRKIASLGSLAIAVFLLAGPASPAQAEKVTRSLKPAHETSNTVSFDLTEVEASTVINARVRLRASQPRLQRWLEQQDGPRAAALREARGRLERDLRANQVKAVAARRSELRVHKPSFASGGTLEVELESGEASSDQTPGLCSFDPATMTASGCSPTFSDTAAVADPVSIWGRTDCETESRHQLSPSGGDPHAAAIGGSQGNDAFRQLTVFDGDDVWGERCELGLNDHRSGPTAIYEEGQRWITMLSFRLPESFPIQQKLWQGVLQMKQTQPADGGGGAPPISLSAFDGHWLLSHSTSNVGGVNGMEQLWKAPATTGEWVRFAFDVTYSQDATKGFVKLYADFNGDGDATDPNEQSPGHSTFTMKTEVPDLVGASADLDGLAPGESIPSHLRVGIYHDPASACAAGCSVDVDNVQALRAG